MLFTLAAVCSLALLLALSGCQTVRQSCSLALATEIPLQHIGHHFAVPAQINGRDMTLVLDTGSDSTVVTAAAARRLGLRQLEGSDVLSSGIGGRQTNDILTTSTFQLGRLHGRHLKLFVSDLGPFGKERLGDGLLGDNFLAAYDLDFNPRLLKATLYKASEGCSTTTVAMGQPLYTVPLYSAPALGDPRPVVIVTVHGQQFRAIIDTGAGGTAMFRSAARRLGLGAADLAKDKETQTTGIGPSVVRSKVHVFEPITIGDLTLTNAPVTILGEDSGDGTEMLLGEDFISRVHLWLSFSSRTLVIQYPPS